MRSWVDDLALEPKWRLPAWHTTPADGIGEIGGARNLETLRIRLASCMVRRVRHEVLSQPPRTDTRMPIEMTAEQIDEHDALNMPIAQILGRAKRRPLTQAEFLRLMTLAEAVALYSVLEGAAVRELMRLEAEADSGAAAKVKCIHAAGAMRSRRATYRRRNTNSGPSDRASYSPRAL
jgi:hypothetical protein